MKCDVLMAFFLVLFIALCTKGVALAAGVRKLSSSFVLPLPIDASAEFFQHQPSFRRLGKGKGKSRQNKDERSKDDPDSSSEDIDDSGIQNEAGTSTHPTSASGVSSKATSDKKTKKDAKNEKKSKRRKSKKKERPPKLTKQEQTMAETDGWDDFQPSSFPSWPAPVGSSDFHFAASNPSLSPTITAPMTSTGPSSTATIYPSQPSSLPTAVTPIQSQPPTQEPSRLSTSLTVLPPGSQFIPDESDGATLDIPHFSTLETPVQPIPFDESEAGSVAVLSRYALEYTVTDNDRTPSQREHVEALKVIQQYLQSHLKHEYARDDTVSFITLLTLLVDTSFNIGGPHYVEYESRAVFDSSSSSSDLIPTADEVGTLLAAALQGGSLERYLRLLQTLPPANIYSTTVKVTLTPPGRSIIPDLEHSPPTGADQDVTVVVEERALDWTTVMAATTTMATFAGVFLVLVLVRAFRQRSCSRLLQVQTGRDGIKDAIEENRLLSPADSTIYTSRSPTTVVNTPPAFESVNVASSFPSQVSNGPLFC